MPIVKLAKDDKPRYHAVTAATECDVNAVVTEYELSESGSREYAEHALQTEYLKRLTEHAYDCAQLAHFVESPPDSEDLLASLQVASRLMRKVLESAVWLRTYEPFTALTADVVERPEYGTGLQLDGECVSALDDDSWEASRSALWARGPWRRDNLARIAADEAARNAAGEWTPAGQKHIDDARDALLAAVDHARKLKERSSKPAASKKLRRTSRARKAA